MSPKVRNFLKYALSVGAVVLGVFGFYTLSVWNRALTPDLYTSAFKESGLYTQVTNLVEAQTTQFLKTEGNIIVQNLLQKAEEKTENERVIIEEELIAWVITTVINNQTENVVNRFSERIDLEQRIETGTEQFLTSSTAWLRGEIEAPEIVQIIPPSSEVESWEPIDLVTSAVVSVGKLAFGLDQLPTCSNRAAEREALQSISSGELRSIQCTSANVDEAINDAVKALIPQDSLQNLETQIGDRIDVYKIETLFANVQDSLIRLSILKEDLAKFREEIQLTRSIAIGVIITSIIFTISAYLVATDRSFKLVLWIFSIIGIVMIIFGFLGNLISRAVIPNLIDLSEFSLNSEVLSKADVLLLEKSFEDATDMIATGLNDQVLLVGFMLMLLAAVPLLLIYLYERNAHKKMERSIEENVTKLRARLSSKEKDSTI